MSITICDQAQFHSPGLSFMTLDFAKVNGLKNHTHQSRTVLPSVVLTCVRLLAF